MHFAYVDCAKAKWTKWHWKIETYPNLRLVNAKNQLQYHYEDDRDHFSLANFATGGFAKMKGMVGHPIPWDPQRKQQSEPQSPVVAVVAIFLVLAGIGAVVYLLLLSKADKPDGKPKKKGKGKKKD